MRLRHALSLAALGLAAPAAAATIDVPGDFPTVTEAVAGAEAGSTIQVAVGDFSTEATVSVTQAVTILGAGASATLLPRFSASMGASLTIESATLACATESEPGINLDAASLTLDKVEASDCSEGPLLFAMKAYDDPTAFSVHIEDSAFEALGGSTGLLYSAYASVTLERVEARQCGISSGAGGALYVSGAPAFSVVDSEFSENRAMGGGAIYASTLAGGEGVPTLTGVRFELNTAKTGAAIRVDGLAGVLTAPTAGAAKAA
jgi:hypothetical protein